MEFTENLKFGLYSEALRLGGQPPPCGLCGGPSRSPGTCGLFRLVCRLPHAGERLATTWAPKARNRWTITHRLSKKIAPSQPLISLLSPDGRTDGRLHGRGVGAGEPPVVGWRPAHRRCPHLFLAGIWPPLTSLWALRLQWDGILKRGGELPANCLPIV